MDKISVVVPIYNTEAYIAECIESVLNQTYENFELILVNDSSTDKSLYICQEYEQKDKRIKVISQENAGVSVARNTGIDIATGKYIAFLDSDDFWDKKYLDILYTSIIKNDSDMASCNFKRYYGKNKSFTFSGFPLTNETINVKDNLADLIYSTSNTVNRDVWGKLFVLDIIKENNLRFIRGLKRGQDYVFFLSYLFKINKITLQMKECLYFYRRSEVSMTTRKLYLDLETEMFIAKNAIDMIDDKFLITNIIFYRTYKHIKNTIRLNISFSDRNDKLKELLKEPLVQKAKENIKLLYMQGYKKRIIYNLLKKKFFLIYLNYHVFRLL